MRLLDALKDGILIGDGANGTCLAAMGFTKQPYDLANIHAPELVEQIHRNYFDAGSNFVETNTFSANIFKLGSYDVDIAQLNREGARLARKAAGDERLVLGAIGPIGKPMAPIGHVTEAEVKEAVRQQAEALLEGGVDGFILETFIDINELKAAVGAIKELSNLPIIASKAFIEDGEMLAEGLPGRSAKLIADLGVDVVGANCIVGPQRMLDLVRNMTEATDLPILAFPTPGLPQLVKGAISYDTAPDYFAKATLRLVEEGARVIGGCCGTTPEHIRELSKLINAAPVKVKKRPSLPAVAKEKEPLKESQWSELSHKLGKKFITAVEMDLPRGLNIQKLLAGARALKIAGVDVVDISDGARARLRMNPVAACTLLQKDVGIDTTMHFSCRDRNLLAVQADLLGCHALGIRNILAVTGDPANIGDYPSATSVFDVDAIGLIRILSRFNEGIDLAGYSVGVKCAFTICCAYNALPLDEDLENDRLKRKVDAGAHVIYTQPVFDQETVDKCVRVAEVTKRPVFVGLLPLRSQRHAEFMHNEVPGISVPEWLRKSIADAADDTEALKVGVEEAQKLAAYIKSVAQGLYLMPPAGSHHIAECVLEATR
ncbi:MAG TPA: bifunctional homocysteine S-methyltransferase/methylenetetrahydrofolate reductase [Fimbriimonadaceae bacterium]